MLKQKRKHKAAAICTESSSFMYITKYMVVYYALIILILRSHNQEQKRGLQGYLKLRLQHLNLLCALIFQVTSTGNNNNISSAAPAPNMFKVSRMRRRQPAQATKTTTKSRLRRTLA